MFSVIVERQQGITFIQVYCRYVFFLNFTYTKLQFVMLNTPCYAYNTLSKEFGTVCSYSLPSKCICWAVFFFWILHSSNCYLWCFSNHKRYMCPSPVSKADSPLLFSSFTHWTKLITLNHRNEEKGNPCQQLWIPEKFPACFCTRYKAMKSTAIAYKSNVINYIIYIYRWCLLLLSFRRVSGLQGCM